MQYHKNWVISKNGILLVLSDEAVATFQKYAQDMSEKLEAGGLLLGYRRLNHFEVLHVTEPTDHDIRSRYHWIRSEKVHQETAKQYWHESKGQITYLGEWHTHPEIVPNPSQIDLNEWAILASKCPYAGGMSMVIVGIEELWCGVVQKKSISQMNKIS